jgi:predicted deacetylase
MSAKFLIRLDDACPTMNREKWDRIEQLLDKYHVKPIVAVIPNNEDPEQQVNERDDLFWEKVKKWQAKGWEIVLHGYNHVYTSNHGGLVPINKKSEFAGLPYEMQEEKIRKGVEIFRQHGIEPKVWVAPAHAFDKNTLKALKEHTSINIISDGIAINPYKRFGFTWIPVQIWGFKKYRFGTWTICLHPNTGKENDIQNLTRGIEANIHRIIQLSDIKEVHSRRILVDRGASILFFSRLEYKKIKNNI